MMALLSPESQTPASNAKYLEDNKYYNSGV